MEFQSIPQRDENLSLDFPSPKKPRFRDQKVILKITVDFDPLKKSQDGQNP